MGNCFLAAVVLRHLICHPEPGPLAQHCPMSVGTAHTKRWGAGPRHPLLSSFCDGYKFLITKISQLHYRLKGAKHIDQTTINVFVLFLWFVQLHTESSPSCEPSLFIFYMAQLKTVFLVLNPLPICATTFFTPTTWSSSTALASEENVVRSINLSSTDTFKLDVIYCIKFCHEVSKEWFKSHVATAFLSTGWKRKGLRRTDG